MDQKDPPLGADAKGGAFFQLGASRKGDANQPRADRRQPRALRNAGGPPVM